MLYRESVEEDGLSVQLEVVAVVFVKGELTSFERFGWSSQQQEIIEEKPNQLLLRFGLFEDTTMKEPPGSNRVGERVEGDLLLQGFLLGLQVHVNLQPLQPLRVLLHPHSLVHLFAQGTSPL